MFLKKKLYKSFSLIGQLDFRFLFVAHPAERNTGQKRAKFKIIKCNWNFVSVMRCTCSMSLWQKGWRLFAQEKLYETCTILSTFFQNWPANSFKHSFVESWQVNWNKYSFLVRSTVKNIWESVFCMYFKCFLVCFNVDYHAKHCLLDITFLKLGCTCFIDIFKNNDILWLF